MSVFDNVGLYQCACCWSNMSVFDAVGLSVCLILLIYWDHALTRTPIESCRARHNGYWDPLIANKTRVSLMVAACRAHNALRDELHVHVILHVILHVIPYYSALVCLKLGSLLDLHMIHVADICQTSLCESYY